MSRFKAVVCACEHAASGAEHGEHLAVEHWLARAATLMRGDAVLLAIISETLVAEPVDG